MLSAQFILTALSCLFILPPASASSLAQKTSIPKSLKNFIADTVAAEANDKESVIRELHNLERAVQKANQKLEDISILLKNEEQGNTRDSSR